MSTSAGSGSLSLGFGLCVALVRLRLKPRTRSTRRRIYIVRHGPKECNTKDADNFELALLPEAHAALETIRAYFDAHNTQFDTVLSSPFRRCRETASRLTPSCAVSIEPGLSECLSEGHGLRGSSSLEILIGRIQGVMNTHRASTHSAIIAAKELQRDEDSTFLQCMIRTCLFVQRLPSTYPHGDLLLVGHGASCIGLINACLIGKAIPFVGDGCPPMGSVTVLEETEGSSGGLGGYQAIGHAVPVRMGVSGKEDGSWECHWRPGPAGGADPNQL